MAKYRKKPVIIEAEQWFPDKGIEGVMLSAVLGTAEDNPSGQYGQIETLEGLMACEPGDYIITDVNGRKYPCRSDIFEAMYEPVEGLTEEKTEELV